MGRRPEPDIVPADRQGRPRPAPGDRLHRITHDLASGTGRSALVWANCRHTASALPITSQAARVRRRPGTRVPGLAQLPRRVQYVKRTPVASDATNGVRITLRRGAATWPNPS